MTKIGLIGCGMWGRNLARNLAQLNVLAAVADRHDGNAAEFAAQFNSQKRGFDAILADPSIDGVVIATSAPSHDQLAIAALKAEGILSTGDDGRLRVRVLAYHDIHTLYELRAELESMAAGLAATHASPAEREFIADIRTKEAAFVDKGTSPVALAKLNGQFHQSIALASDNPFLIEALQRLSTLMVLLGPTAYSLPSRVREIGTEHDAINNAIQSSDPAAARQAAQTHLQDAVKARLHIIAAGYKESLD